MLSSEETIALFNQAHGEVVRASASTSIELDINQLQQLTPSEHEHLAILFDLAAEELGSPETAGRYLSLEEIRARQNADSSALVKALNRFERIVQAPFSFKGKKSSPATGTTSYRQPVARAAIKVVPAEPRARLSALAIDMGLASLVALGIVVLLSPILKGELIGDIQITKARDLSLFMPLIALYLKVLLLTLMIYPCCLLLLRGRTPGLTRNRIKLASTNGSPPAPAQIIARALLTPLSLIMLSPLAVLNRQRTMSDQLSRTTICKI